MSSKKIIKIEKIHHSPQRYKQVEWWLHNVCNFDCSFCRPEFKAGDLRWLDLSVYKNFCQRLMSQADSESHIVFFQFLGGEPTLFPHLLELCQFIVDSGHQINIMTNGSRTLRYWKDWANANIINTLYITIHPEQTQDIQHYVDLINLFEGKNTLIIPRISAPTHCFDLANEFFDILYQKTASVLALHPINEEFRDNYYSQKQLEIFKKRDYVQSLNFNFDRLNLKHLTPKKIEITHSDQTKSISTSGQVWGSGQNNFFGWSCNIGIEFLHIFHTDIYKSICRQDGKIGTIFDEDAGFSKKPTTCMKQWCFCRSDISISKHDKNFFK